MHRACRKIQCKRRHNRFIFWQEWRLYQALSG
jgi:hypothetical protein